ncbi:receptor-binding cancer antigen expressed on SiSo cells isoform X2 [Malaclemys terrapin pileata]|uniref:receptor-binding cancer antigen expressed on SiSo cells isoform X2 n=1 Tax=Malaclemys terrapin pileata TaxID=2991368 RepID=UPI0023A7BC26|nr:receptor-binding cancer antigen expressed on SiSo cells isoform X2 [Malaclemys terrapin pileata]
MAITQFRLFKICTCLAAVLSFIKRLICRSECCNPRVTFQLEKPSGFVLSLRAVWKSSAHKLENGDALPSLTMLMFSDLGGILHFSFRSGRGRKLSGDQITLPTTVDYSSVPKQSEVEDWTSWDEEAPTSVKIDGGNGNVATQQNASEQLEPDYFKDMTPTIRKTQKIVIKKREPLNFGIQDGNAGFSSRLAATQDIPFIHQSPELGDLDTWQENTNAWEEEEDAAWQAEEVLRQQKIAEREKRAAEQQRKKMEKEAQRLMKKEQNKIGVKLS